MHFSSLDPHMKRDLIQLEACLEHALPVSKKAYFAKHGRYFDPNGKGIRHAWWQIEGYTWEFLAYEHRILVGGEGPTWTGMVSLGLGL